MYMVRSFIVSIAPELVDGGYIVPPKVKVQKYDVGGGKDINED